MWSPDLHPHASRNRVSPIQNGPNKRIGSEAKSTSGVHVEVHQNGKNSSHNLTELIRKRKYNKSDGSQTGHWFPVDSNAERQWTAPLSERLKNKHAFHSRVVKEKHKSSTSVCKEIGYSLDLWRPTFNKIEGYQGTGVLSFFIFLKWMIWLNLFLSVIVLTFVVIPYSVVPSMGGYATGYTTGVTGTNVSGVDTGSTTTCTGWYRNNLKYDLDAASLIQDYLQGTGWMEGKALFYGWYDALELDFGRSVGGQDLNYIFPFAYFMTTLGVFFFSLVHMTGFVLSSVRESADDDYSASEVEYCGKVFGGWEHTLYSDNADVVKCRSIYRDLLANLNNQRYMLTREALTTGQTCKLFTLRFLVNVLILGMLGGAGYLIYRVIEWSTEYLEDESSSGSFVVLLFQFLPSLTITILNIILPIIFQILVLLEDYREEVVINITLARTVFLRLASLVMLMISLYNNINCSTKETTCNTNESPCIVIRCWETFVGQAFYRLMVTDFFVKVIVTFLVELPRKLLTTKCSCGICAKIGPAEFDVSLCVLDLVYTQALCWMGFFYCPLLPAMGFISLCVTMFLKLFSAFISTKPAEKPYKASKSNHFFILILFITFLVCCVPVTYAILKIRPSKGCGPFRIYTSMGICVDTTIDSNWFASAAIIVGIFLITFLCLVIAFCCVRGSALSKKSRILEKQLLKESREKQILMDKVHSTNGRGNVNRKPVHMSTGRPLGNNKPRPKPVDDDLDTLWM